MLRALLCLCLSAALAHAGPGENVVAALADVQTRTAFEQVQLRYLAISHMPEGQRQELWQVISGHVNGTSREPGIYRPAVLLAPVKSGGPLEEADGLFVKKEDWKRAVLIRINLLHYGYDRDVWELLAKVEPHYHFREKKQEAVVVKVQSPVVQGPPSVSETLTVALTEESYWKGRHVARELANYGDRTGYRYKYPAASDGRIHWYSEGYYPALPKDAKRVSIEQKPETLKAKPAVKKVQEVHGAWLPPKEIAALAVATNSDVPILNADFFYWQTGIQSERAPGPGYYDLAGIKDEATYDRLIGFDRKQAAKDFKGVTFERRAAVAKSGVAYSPRRVSEFVEGLLWITFDNKVAVGNRNPLDTPDDTFLFDATEQYGRLPNGLWLFGLFNAAGVRQDSAPDFIGKDTTAADKRGRIEVGVSCLACHDNGGLQDFKDHYKNQFRVSAKPGEPTVRVDSPDFNLLYDVQRFYFRDLDLTLKQSRERYAVALLTATGLKPEQYAKAVRNVWYNYADAATVVDMARAARELGVTKDHLQKALRFYKLESLRGYTVLDMFLRPEKEQVPIPLEAWHESITEAYKALASYGGGKP